MKKINYLLIAIATLFLFTADTFALTINDIEFNQTKEQLQEAVELIKNSDKFKEYEANYKYYIFTYVMANNQTNLFNFLDSVDRMRICFFENQNIDINNTINCDSSVLSFKLDGTFKSSSTTNQLYVQNINNLIDTNMTATYNEDLTDSKGNIIYSAGQNIFANYYLKPEEEKITLPGIEGQPEGSWFPFLLNKTSFDNFITINYNLDPTTENMVILYITINIILLVYLLKIIQKYIYFLLRKLGVVS